MSTTTCTWTDDGDELWFSDCCKAFIFTEGGPIHNGFEFCPYCGKPIDEDEFEDQDIEDPEEHDEVFCDSCGADIGDGICGFCHDLGNQ